ncbi:MAG: hypothetical protein M1610_01505 [Nitrospirae bacterium]|nr:hypothetical protein [Nitrospirota bacterium]MDA8338466.1 hypothetical protein [Nitrospiraceae bacterium]
MRWKLIVILLLAFCLMVQPATAEKGKAKAGGKTTTKPTKCWKRMPPLDKTLMTPEYNTVCKAFEEVLNKTCEPPEKLQCNWTLPKGEKRFKKLEWQPLDPKEHWGLIEDMALSGWNEKFRTGQWERIGDEVRKEFDNGQRILAVTSVDIDHDGNAELVVRDDNIPCEGNAGVTFGVMIPEIKRIDWNLNNVFFHTNAFSEGSEIMIYEGQAFMFKWERDFKEAMIYEGFPHGSGNVCRFKYLKGRKKQ